MRFIKKKEMIFKKNKNSLLAENDEAAEKLKK